MESPIDLNRPVENPTLCEALESYSRDSSEANLRRLVGELNRGIYLVPVLMDEAEVRGETPGEAAISKGSLIKVMHCEDDEGQTWLGLFTDWNQIRAWTDAPVDTLVMPASDAWDFAETSEYRGAVVNPAGHALSLDGRRIAFLKAAQRSEAG